MGPSAKSLHEAIFALSVCSPEALGIRELPLLSRGHSAESQSSSGCETFVKQTFKKGNELPSHFMKFWGILLGAFLMATQVKAQTLISGELRDLANDSLMADVNIRNIHTLLGMSTKADGRFELMVKKGELIEFSKLGYQTIRIRIQNEKEPNYYKLVMSKVPIQLREVDIRGKPLDFKKDSIRYRETYDLVLRKQNRSEVDMRSMPLAMLSKRNRQEWAFQEMYAEWEKEKFIDFAFNDRLVKRITYLDGEELNAFMLRYRPPYEFLREASDYEFLDYIKHCYYIFTKEYPAQKK